MRLYRCSVRWSNGTIALARDSIYELTDDEVAQVETDCVGALTVLSDAEVSDIVEPLRAAGCTSFTFRPPAPDRSGAGRGTGDGAMTSANMTGLVAR